MADLIYRCPRCGESFVRESGLQYHIDHLCVEEIGISKKPTAETICLEAAKLVGGDRQVPHGDKTINFQNTADVWNAILRAKARREGYVGGLQVELDALDVGNMLEAFKIARRYSGVYNPDDYIDGAGYAGCAGEIAAQADTKDA
jgi:hypothetical protein